MLTGALCTVSATKKGSGEITNLQTPEKPEMPGAKAGAAFALLWHEEAVLQCGGELMNQAEEALGRGKRVSVGAG